MPLRPRGPAGRPETRVTPGAALGGSRDADTPTVPIHLSFVCVGVQRPKAQSLSPFDQLLLVAPGALYPRQSCQVNSAQLPGEGPRAIGPRPAGFRSVEQRLSDTQSIYFSIWIQLTEALVVLLERQTQLKIALPLPSPQKLSTVRSLFEKKSY